MGNWGVNTGTGSYAGKVGWSVGLASWLDSPASKVNRYWRAMEEGQDFKGVILIGLWGDVAGTNARPGRVRFRALDAPQAGVGNQKFVPFGETSSPSSALARARFAFWYYITHGKMGRPDVADLSVLHGGTPKDNRAIFYWVLTKAPLEKIPFVSARAKKAVVARHYYMTALGTFNPLPHEAAALRARIGPLIKGAFTQQKARNLIALDSSRSARTSRAPRSVTSVGQLTSYLGEDREGLGMMIAGADTQDLLRVGGQFPAGQWQQMLYEINSAVAKEFQEQVAAVMRGGPHTRPATEDLIRATLDPRNRYPNS